MAKKPILFSGEMVNAILDGRKVMTRRAVKPQPPEGFRLWGRCIDDHASWTDHPLQGEKGDIFRATCPYGKPGDTLWVRETFMIERFPSAPDKPLVHYRADNTAAGSAWTAARMWKPSIFMPRWAGRINLRIADVRAERLQEISETDAVAEGLTSWTNEKQPDITHYGIAIVDEVWSTDPRLVFQRLWDSINAKRGCGWDANPWVWVVSFEKI